MLYVEDDSSNNFRPGDVRVTREIYRRSDFDEKFEYHQSPSSVLRSVKKRASSCCTTRAFRKAFLGFFPFISILGQYNWKRNLIRDVIAGLTVSAMHIPQGMAYGQLATLSPVHGLYISFFPVLLYFFFGTSRHISIGSFAVISLMVAKVLDVELSKDHFQQIIQSSINASEAGRNFSDDSSIQKAVELQTRIDLAVSLNLITGVMQIVLGFLGFGFITQYLSEPFISGYTTGCACHVFTSQLKYVFGIIVPRHTGAFKIYETWRDVILKIDKTNFVTLGLSAGATVFLLVCKLVVDPKLKQFSPMPIPAELLLMIIADAISFAARLEPDHNVDVVGEIPSDFPRPRLPVYFSSGLIFDSIPLVLVSFSLCISMGKLFAKKNNYRIKPNQEFFALGISNALASFFDCYTSSASLSRSLVQANVGGQSQLASLFSCSVILAVILFLGFLLQPLPNCILAVVVMVNLRGMFMQFGDLRKFWRHCKIDVATWIVAFFATVLIDVDIGLYIGVAFVMVTVILRSARVYASVLRQAGQTDLFAVAKSYNKLSSTAPAVIVRWSSPLYFATAEKFVSLVSNAPNITPKNTERDPTPDPRYLPRSKSVDSRIGEMEPVKIAFGEDEEPVDSLAVPHTADNLASPRSLIDESFQTTVSRWKSEDRISLSSPTQCSNLITAVILDLSGVTFIDTVGLEAIKQLVKEMPTKGFDVLLAPCPECVIQILDTDKTMEEFTRSNIYLSTIDALVAVRSGGRFARIKSSTDVPKATPRSHLSASTSRTPRHRNLTVDSHASLIQLDDEEPLDSETDQRPIN